MSTETNGHLELAAVQQCDYVTLKSDII